MTKDRFELAKKKEAEMRMKELFPFRYEGRNPAYTHLKHNFIYNEYLKIVEEVRDRFPELASFLPQRYYYQIISYRFSLTPNYVCAIINRVKRQRKSLEVSSSEVDNNVSNGRY